MQKESGSLARNPTGEEIRDIIKGIWAKIQAAMKAGEWPEWLEPVYSFDNANVHKWAVKGWDNPKEWRIAAGIRGKVHFVPPYSPDLHQVVEHGHANCCKRYCKVAREYIMGQKPLPKSVLEFVPEVERCFKEGNSLESLEKAICKLERVYEEVIAKGGDFVSSRLS